MAKFSRLSYKPSRTSTCSPVPAIFLTKESVDAANEFHKNLDKRMRRGRELILLELSKVMLEAVQGKAPKIKSGKGEYDYAKDLKIGIVDGTDEDAAVAIWLEDRKTKITEEDESAVALFIRPTAVSPPYIGVLMRYQPWPADIMPVKLEPSEAKIVSRRIRPDESAKLKGRIAKYRTKIESELQKAGAKDASIDTGSRAIGMEVHEDIGHAVLRSEFGFSDDKNVMVWRPAIKEMHKQLPKSAKKFLHYLKTGNESLFDVPDRDDINLGQMEKGMFFQEELAPFSKR